MSHRVPHSCSMVAALDDLSFLGSALDFGDVGVRQRLAVGEMRDQRADAAAEQPVDKRRDSSPTASARSTAGLWR